MTVNAPENDKGLPNDGGPRSVRLNAIKGDAAAVPLPPPRPPEFQAPSTAPSYVPPSFKTRSSIPIGSFQVPEGNIEPICTAMFGSCLPGAQVDLINKPESITVRAYSGNNKARLEMLRDGSIIGEQGGVTIALHADGTIVTIDKSKSTGEPSTQTVEKFPDNPKLREAIRDGAARVSTALDGLNADLNLKSAEPPRATPKSLAP
jgi:hypothetical protein